LIAVDLVDVATNAILGFGDDDDDVPAQSER
jgi:hypothetical protein